MKIAQVGSLFSQIPQVDFYSRSTFLEYDLLIIDFNVIANQSRNNGRELFDSRNKNLAEFMNYKKVPVVYLAPNVDRIQLVENGAYTYKFLSEIFPVPKFETEEEEGTTIFINPKTPFSDFLEKYKTWFGYTRFYKSLVGRPIAVTPFTKKLLAFYTEQAVFLPQIKSRETQKEKDFLLELLACIKTVRVDLNSSILPEWTDSYFLPGEYEALQTINQLNAQIEKLRKEVQESKAQIQRIKSKKRLLTTSGHELEKSVEEIFKELGFEIIPTEENRDDLIVRYGNDIAIVEIKGVASSAAEKNAAQLEKWRAMYMELYEVNPKGLLLVNTFRDMPLRERNQPDFPEQMLRYAVGREHCLITTVQLLGLYYEVIQNPASKEHIIKSLFTTIGRYSDEFKWQKYIRTADN